MLANPVVGIVECPLFDYLVPNHWHRVEKRDRLGGTSGHLRFSGRCLLIIASGCWSKALLVPLNPKKIGRKEGLVGGTQLKPQALKFSNEMKIQDLQLKFTDGWFRHF